MAARNHITRIALAGLVVAGVALAPTARATQDVSTQRLAGENRYATAAAIALKAYPQGAGEVVVASGESFPDALAASYLAGVVAGPILLVTRSTVPAVTAETLAKLNATKVWLVGGTAAIEPAVATELDKNYTVDRIGGADRYDTARMIKVRMTLQPVGRYNNKRTAFVASGESFADALAAGPIAFGRRFPLLLTQRDSLPKATEDEGLDGMEHVIIVGGEAAVSPAVEALLRQKTLTVERIGGENRNDTAARLGEFALANLAFKNTEVVLADGRGYADALAGAPYGGKLQFPVLLMDGVPPETEAFVRNHNSTIAMLTALGGDNAIAPADLDALRAAATCNPAPATTAPGGVLPTSSTSIPPCSTATTASPTTSTTTSSTTTTTSPSPTITFFSAPLP